MQEIEIKNVSDMLSALSKLQFQFGHSTRGNGFIFRGQRNASFGLLPSIYREYSEKQHSRLTNGYIQGKMYSTNENEILAHFKKEASGILTSVAQNDDFTWLQYAQHYGVPTRLLDFTSNPLIALYFCCKSESEEDGAVWVLNCHTYQRWMISDLIRDFPDATTITVQTSIMDSLKGRFSEDPDRIELKRALMFIPAYIDQRMAAQASRFLLWGADRKPLEEMVTSSEEMILSETGVAYGIADDTRFLSKIVVPDLCKHDILRTLALMNVSEKTVFPGLDGIGRDLECYYRNNADDNCRSW